MFYNSIFLIQKVFLICLWELGIYFGPDIHGVAGETGHWVAVSRVKERINPFTAVAKTRSQTEILLFMLTWIERYIMIYKHHS
jgi:hypothetical protein